MNHAGGESPMPFKFKEAALVSGRGKVSPEAKFLAAESGLDSHDLCLRFKA